jgi:pimeloyl-ACP methyl ester carboxylesterase
VTDSSNALAHLPATSSLPPRLRQYADHAKAANTLKAYCIDCTDRLDQLRMPVVIMHGKNDRSARYALAQEMHASITSSHMITFSGGHLFPLMGESQRFLDSLTETLGPGSEDPL